ncbi:MAG: outer membrane protein assembly factor BamA [Paraglaciecola sp.]|jgi:outer membrane protein assembly factor BamA
MAKAATILPGPCPRLQTQNQDGNAPGPVKIGTVDKINIDTRAIFEESDPDTIALHRFANWMHYDTRKSVVERLLPFKAGGVVSDFELAEAERILRKESYLRDANVTAVRDCDGNTQVDVTTWDNWSLLPTFSFGRKGGENKLALGFDEDNLLGTGIRTTVRYKKDDQRSGYQVDFRSPVPYLSHATISTRLMDNDDGQLVQVILNDPFYQSSTQHMFNVHYETDQRTERVYQNGGTRNRFALDHDFQQFTYGKLLQHNLQGDDYGDVLRLTTGVTLDRTRFALPGFEQTAQDPLFLPQDRDYLYPWLGLEYRQAEFKVMSNVYLIEQNEDFNLGWHHSMRFGVDVNTQQTDSRLFHLNFDSRKGYQWQDYLLLLSAQGESVFDGDQHNQLKFKVSAEHFYRLDETWSLYSKQSLTTSAQQFLDQPVVIGGDSGARGYPLQYQHGEHSALLNAEIRIYPKYNLYKLFDIAMVAFADTGRAWGGDEGIFNESDAILASIGVGARIYASRSSHHNVVHIDFAKPLVSSEFVDSWEWRLQVKNSF